MASATVIQFPTGRGSGPGPIKAGNMYLTKATEMVVSRFGKTLTAVLIDADGDLRLIDSECDSFTSAIAAPGFACLCSEGADPVRLAGRLRSAHMRALASLGETADLS